MAHPQGTIRGLISKQELNVGSSVGAGRVLPPVATLPSTDKGISIQFISNSTGVALAVNTTGTTWKYLNVTSIQPT